MTDKYLVHIWAGVRSIKITETFDQLWVENYASTSAGIDAHPMWSEANFTEKPFYYSIGECQLSTTADELEARLVAVRQECCVSYYSSQSQNTRDIKPAT